jgi:hypothetical protein
MGTCFFAQASLAHDPPFILPITAGIIDMYYHAQLFSVEMGVSQAFLPGLAGTKILQISASQVLGLQWMPHHAWPPMQSCNVNFIMFLVEEGTPRRQKVLKTCVPSPAPLLSLPETQFPHLWNRGKQDDKGC